MEALNKVELRGTVGESKITNIGTAKVCNFSVCTQRAYRSRDGQDVIENMWHKVSIWATTDKQAEYIARIKPNCAVQVTGRMKVRTYVRQDGMQATLHEIAAQRVEILKDMVTPETENSNK